jgi:hypothetical protein
MTTTINILGLSIALLFAHLPASANQIYQWTDLAGTVHFTDNLSSIPESIRNSRQVITRNDLAVTDQSISGPQTTRPQQSLPQLSQAPVESEREQIVPPTIVIVPQETTIVVVNSHRDRKKPPPCVQGPHCPPAFRPNFNDRRYIHPSVFFPGGSRQYIEPRVVVPTPARRRG